ncbi:hypothetical protein RKK42_31265 [Klebsiella pneumoniae]|nr:hypothetical protein [Klebsiella pneumoniae]
MFFGPEGGGARFLAGLEKNSAKSGAKNGLKNPPGTSKTNKNQQNSRATDFLPKPQRGRPIQGKGGGRGGGAKKKKKQTGKRNGPVGSLIGDGGNAGRGQKEETGFV